MDFIWILLGMFISVLSHLAVYLVGRNSINKEAKKALRASSEVMVAQDLFIRKIFSKLGKIKNLKESDFHNHIFN